MAIIIAIVSYCFIFVDMSNYETFALIGMASFLELFFIGVLINDIMDDINNQID